MLRGVKQQYEQMKLSTLLVIKNMNRSVCNAIC